jgi:general secretion pathway protein I
MRLFRWTRRPNSHSRGFTLVESLVALTVMMLLLVAIGGLAATSLRSGRYVERHLADIESTRQIIAGLPARGHLKNGSLSGEMVGYRWRIDAAPYRPDFFEPKSPPPWTPQVIALRVESPNGGVTSVDIVRLVRAAAR